MAPDPPVLEIVIGVVLRDDGRFLAQPRAGDPAMDGLWELPGGKVEPGEDHPAALAREVREETGLAVRVDPEPLCALCHAYPDRRVALWVHVCVADGTGPAGARWVTPAEYARMEIPAANAPIAAALERASPRRPPA